MRASFLAQDRADLSEAVKSLGRQMSAPQSIEHGGPEASGSVPEGLALRSECFEAAKNAEVHPRECGLRLRGRSAESMGTTGMVQRLVTQCLKGSSNLQAATGMNVGETDDYALVRGAGAPRRQGSPTGSNDRE